MDEKTHELWQLQNRVPGDRIHLFSAVAESVGASTVLYPGCFVDIAASFVFEAVYYVDVDQRAARFFADDDGVRELVAQFRSPNIAPKIEFIHDDYTNELDLPEQHFDLLISLYAGFISEHCTNHLKVGGKLLVNPSHGDAALASLDERYQLYGAVISRAGDYWVETSNLESYLIAKKPGDLTVEALHNSGRGVSYTKAAFAYIFERVL